MLRRKIVPAVLLVAVAGVIVLAVVLLRHQEEPAVPDSGEFGPSAEHPPPATRQDDAQHARSAPSPKQDTVSGEDANALPLRPERPPPERTEDPEDVTSADAGVSVDRIVATVNDVAITLQDLAPGLKSTATERDLGMSREMYAYRLERAIDRQLTFQAARALGLEVTDEKRRELKARRESHVGDEGVIDELGDPKAAAALDVIQDEAHLLEKALLQEEGIAPPYVTQAQVEEHYREHAGDYEPLPEDDSSAREAARQRIDVDIRQKLAAIARTEYQRERQEYFRRLRSEAQIVLEVSPEQLAEGDLLRVGSDIRP